jgi:pyruvate-formate lyase-activating enzyme
MNVEQIKQALALMSEKEQNHVAAYLVHRRNLRDPEHATKLARKIDDRDPAHWISLEELQNRWDD